MTRAILVHGIWGLVAVAALIGGNYFASPGVDPAADRGNREGRSDFSNRNKDGLGTDSGGKLKAGLVSPEKGGLPEGAGGLVFLEKPALTAGRPQRPFRRHVDHLAISGIDDDLADMLRALEAHALPGASAV